MMGDHESTVKPIVLALPMESVCGGLAGGTGMVVTFIVALVRSIVLLLLRILLLLQL